MLPVAGERRRTEAPPWPYSREGKGERRRIPVEKDEISGSFGPWFLGPGNERDPVWPNLH